MEREKGCCMDNLRSFISPDRKKHKYHCKINTAYFRPTHNLKFKNKKRDVTMLHFDILYYRDY